MNALRLHAAGVSHTGLVRQTNEDSMVMRDNVGLWAVADGMGGLQHGQWASGELATLLDAVPLSGDLAANVETVSEAIQQANARILSVAQQSNAQMGTTAAVLLLTQADFAAIWVGDSRAYLCRNGVLHRISRDHTQVQEMVDAGLLAPEAAHKHPKSHILSRAVGVEPNVAVDAVTDDAELHDTFLLCSDGLTCVVEDPEIQDVLSTRSVQAAVNQLLEMALARGAPDNVTVIAVQCEEATTQINLQASA